MRHKWKSKVTIPYTRDYPWNKIIGKAHIQGEGTKYLVKDSWEVRNVFDNKKEFMRYLLLELDVWNCRVEGRVILLPDLIRILKFIEEESDKKQISYFQGEGRERKIDRKVVQPKLRDKVAELMTLA